MLAKVPEIPSHFVLQLLASDLLPETVKTTLEQTCQHAGFDVASLTGATSLPLACLKPLISLEPELSTQRLAIEFGDKICLTSHGRLSLFAMTATTLREAMMVVNYLPLITSLVSFDVTHSHDHTYIYIHTHTGQTSLDQLFVYYCFAALHRLIKLLTGTTDGIQIYINQDQPAALMDHPVIQPNIWHFNAYSNCLTLSHNLLNTPLLFADAVTHHMMQAQCRQELAALLPYLSTRYKVWQLLEHCTAYPSLEEVALLMNMSTRSIKRKLQAENCSFTELLQEGKRLRAIRLLTTSPMSCQDIAFALGYNTSSAFCHAFERWMQCSPRDFRQHHTT